MRIERHSCLIKPTQDIWWMSTHAGPSFVKQISHSLLEIYVTGRSTDNKSRIGRAHVKISSDKTLKCIHIDDDPIFDIGNTGLFDESGVSYPWLVSDSRYEYMFYVGWSRSSTTGFQNFLGLASRDLGSSDSEFERVYKVPILDRCNDEPFGTGSCCVTRENNQWVMIYTSFLGWEKDNKKSQFHKNKQPSYLLKIATSTDLVNWKRLNKKAVEFEGDEHIIGKPMYLLDDNRKKAELWFSVRGNAYRIGYASGKNIYNLKRVPMNEVVLSPPPVNDEWDFETQEYAFVTNVNSRKLVFYNGNEYGKTGLGYGEWIDE